MPDDQDQGPSLEPPSLFGRSKKAKQPKQPKSPKPPRAATVTTPAPAPAPKPDDAVTAPLPVTEDEPTFVSAARPAAETRTETAPPADPTRTERPARTPRVARVAKIAQATKAATTIPVPQSAKAAKTPRAPRQRPTRPALPPLPTLTVLTGLSGRTAAAVSGLVVGGVLVLLTYLGLRGCELAVGTTSCGTGPGLTFLVAIVILGVAAGRALLGLFGVPDPTSTSFLGVGLTGVIALLFLVDVLDSWWMAIVIPVVTALTFPLSWWVTTTFVEPAKD